MDTYELRQALSKISHVVGKPKGQAWDGIYCGEHLSATDLSQIATVKGITFDKPVILPAKFIDIVNSITAPEITVDVDDNYNATIKAGGASFKLHGHSAEDYPTFDLEQAETFAVNGAEFKKAVQSVMFAASTDEIRPAFNGIRCDGKMMASDTYRLAVADFEFPTCLIPAKFFSHINKLPDGDIRVRLTDGIVAFEADNLLLATRLLGENYPDVSGVLPNEHKTVVTVERDELIAMLNRALLLTDGRNSAVNVIVDNNLTVKVDSDQGRMEEVIDAGVEGEPIDLYLNAKYFLDVLKIAPEQVNIYFNGDGQPVVIKWAGYLYLQLPIKKY